MFKVEANETLLFVTEHTGNRIYIGETDFFDRPWTEARLIAELSGADVVRVLKLDLGSLKTTEVTNDCAKIWLEDTDAQCYEIDPDNLPQFVADSRAWAEWSMTEPAPKNEPDPDYLYEEKRDRLNPVFDHIFATVFGARL